MQDYQETFARLEWVRPIAATMRAVSLPEPMVQKAMGDVLRRLDEYLDGER